jgi:hypothetical protein
MPYADPAKQKAAQNKWAKENYHAKIESRRAFFRKYHADRRARLALEETARLRKEREAEKVGARYGYSGTIQPNHF